MAVQHSMILLDGFEELWLGHFLKNRGVMLTECPHKLSISVQKHGVLLVIVVQKGSLEVPSLKKVEAGALLIYIAALVE